MNAEDIFGIGVGVLALGLTVKVVDKFLDKDKRSFKLKI